MTAALKSWLKGAAVAAASMFLYAIALGFFLALTLLVISMEEGGDNISQASVPLTQMVVLLSEGVGFHAGSITVTVTPLLLTILLIALIASISRRVSVSPHAYASGLVVWLIANYAFSQGVTVVLLDADWLLLLKSAAVFTAGFLIAAVPSWSWPVKVKQMLRDRLPQPARHSLVVGAGLGFTLVAWYLLIGVITLIAWTAMNYRGMVAVFDLSHMQLWSRVLISICSLAWLPNLCIWAVSWLFGAGFAIGELATFTLWIGSSNALPPIPLFGLFPQPLDDTMLRTAVMMIPLVSGLIFAGVLLVFRFGFAIRPIRSDDPRDDLPRLVAIVASPAMSFLLASVIVTIASMLLFLASNGSLGTGRLKNVGVDIVASTQAVSRPTAFGLFAAWLMALITVAGGVGIRLVMLRIRQHANTGDTTNDLEGGGEIHRRDREKGTRLARNVRSQNKEEQDDSYEPTHTKGSGIRIP